jgi:hypothetical protein
MATKNDASWETIAENCTNDAGCTPEIRELVRALATRLRQQDEEIARLRDRLTRLWWQVNPEGDDPP